MVAFPALNRIYDVSFLATVSQEPGLDNHLLWLLAQPGGEYATDYWRSLLDDLDLLEPEGAWHGFSDKLHNLGKEDFEGARSEIALAAWMKRRGVTVALEPLTRGERNCDFSAATNPRTWWEVKSIRDLDAFFNNEVVARQVHARLRRINEPYILSLLPSTLHKKDVARALKQLKAELAEHYRLQRQLPFEFDAFGLRVQATAKTTRPRGYLGTLQQEFFGGDEIASRARGRILKALNQLPDDEAGIVVIDTTVSSWSSRDDIRDACFGLEVSVYTNGSLIDCRDTAKGAFKPNERRRISAVVHYTRSPRETDEPYSLFVFHNPFARYPLADACLSGENVIQSRRIETTGGRFGFRDF